MVISDNLYYFGLALDAACKEWELKTGQKAELSDWIFRDFLAQFLANQAVMIKAIGDSEVEQLHIYHSSGISSASSYRSSLAAACGCTQHVTT